MTLAGISLAMQGLVLNYFGSPVNVFFIEYIMFLNNHF